ncbi:hypothetical protein JWJ90_13430 [Desulfobulbus rhabdoformis]|uniref:hypothetical protein n=1 Tax=Desulfobulbus rhabdoformis TaxID=34032 RepID=UPI0019630EEC|nr:hypothetical protein [Desulfobulbus rhabdoformis]MBM9615280.1 hypothetical protein [Desulfobulbus rhabdoformis]
MDRLAKGVVRILGTVSTQIFYRIAKDNYIDSHQITGVSVDSSNGYVSVTYDVESVMSEKWYVYFYSAYFAEGAWYRVNTAREKMNRDEAEIAAMAATVDAIQISSGTTAAMLDAQGSCPSTDPCADKAGTSAGWQLINYTEGSTPVPQNTCVDGCQVEASQINELPCSGSSCAATVQFTYTGQECGAGEYINTDPEQPSACETQWTAKKNECGGAANIGSFDWSTCTGECSEPENSCAAAWANLAERCGDEGLIVNWNSKDCTGQCKDDPKPDVENGDYPPESVKTETTTNSDGSYDVTKTTTYNIDGDTYTTTETTNYASDGTETGSTTTESQGNSGSDSEGEGEEESFGAIITDSFGEGYAPSTELYDIPTRFNTFLSNVQSSGLFSFSSNYFSSLPSGGSSVFVIDGGNTFGTHSLDLSDTMATGLAVLRSILFACFGFLSIRAIIMKR